jgi:hypothetical protein
MWIDEQPAVLESRSRGRTAFRQRLGIFSFVRAGPAVRRPFDAVPPRQRRSSEESAPRLPARPPPSRRWQPARAHAKEELSDARFKIEKSVLTYLFDEDGFYEQLADKLIENLPWTRRVARGHWLCKQLAAAAEGLDPDTWAKLAGRSARAGLVALGLPEYMADALGAGAGVTLKIAFGHTPIGNLSKVLRVLIPLVCPNIGRCPAEIEVVKTLVTPLIADRLKEMARN